MLVLLGATTGWPQSFANTTLPCGRTAAAPARNFRTFEQLLGFASPSRRFRRRDSPWKGANIGKRFLSNHTQEII
jgi:hypothetical protein